MIASQVLRLLSFRWAERSTCFFGKSRRKQAMSISDTSESREQQYVQRTQELLEQVKVKNKLEFTVLKVEFVQEDGSWYLRVYCDNDREGGIGAEDLAQITRPLNKLLDKADFIPMAYTLEVCSPGFM